MSVAIIENVKKTQLLGYPELIVNDLESTDDTYFAYARPSLLRSDHCPKCNGKHVQQRGYEPRKIKDYALCDNEVKIITVRYRQRQFWCVDGKHSFGETIECYGPGETIATRLKRFIYFLGCSETSWSKIAKCVGISFETVASVFKEVGTTLRLASTGYKSPEHMAIRSLTISGRPYTIIANLDDSTIISFCGGKPETVLLARKGINQYVIRKELFEKTNYVVVEPKCSYEYALRKRINARCSVVVDQYLLHRQLLDGIEKVAKEHFSKYKTAKIMEYVSPFYYVDDQKIFNFLNRAFAESEELKIEYSAYNTFQLKTHLREDSEMLAMPDEQFAFYLETQGYVPKSMQKDTFKEHTLSDYYGIDSFRQLIDVLTSEFSAVTKNLLPDTVEDRIFYCVPNTFEDRKSWSRSYTRASCFDMSLTDGDAYTPLGKAFSDIENNLQYRKDFMAGKRGYIGPDEIVKSIW